MAWVLVVGDPIDGLAFIGPFEDMEDATEHTNINETWWLAELQAPVEKGGN